MSNWFLTENYLRANGIIGANVDVNQYKGIIEFSAKAFIKPLIGSHFFNDLFTKYNAQTLDANETVVVEIMQKCIAYRVKAQAIIELNFQLTNKGTMKQSDDFGSPADISEITYLYSHNISHVTLFQAELTTYLTDNKALFAEFISVDNNDSSIKKNCKDNGSGYNEANGFMII